MATTTSRDLTQVTLAFLFLGMLVIVSYLIVEPFLGAIVWAGMIVIATWPYMLKLQHRLFNKRSLAVTLMTIGLLFILIIPLWMAISGVVRNVGDISDIAQNFSSAKIPPPPVGLEQIPVVGPKLVARWIEFASKDREEISAIVRPYVVQVLGWFASSVGDLGRLFINFLLTVAISAIFYMRGESVANGFRAFAKRLAGEKGDNIVVLSAQAIRAVALGIVVTSLVQSVMAGFGFLIVGVSHPLFLTAFVFLLCVVQIGAWLALFPVVGWLYFSGAQGWAIAMLVWSIIIIAIDNILRPILIKKGADLPLILIFTGVIGGLLAFGILGLFIGPVVLAVAYTLLKAWVEGQS